MGTEFKDEIEGLIDRRSQAYTDISDAIWGFAEPRFQERESSRIQQEYFKLQRLFRPGRSGGRGDGVYRGIRQREAGDRIFRRI